LLCAQTCHDGDFVKLRQITAVAATVTTSERWPFNLLCAEQVAVPAAARFRQRAGERELPRPPELDRHRLTPRRAVTRGRARSRDRGGHRVAPYADEQVGSNPGVP